MSISDPLNHLGLIWQQLEPLVETFFPCLKKVIKTARKNCPTDPNSQKVQRKPLIEEL